MSFLSLFSSKSAAVGLEAGSNWLKLVRVAPGRSGLELNRMARMIWQGADSDKQEAASALSTLWKELGIKEKVVVSSMAGHAVIIKRVSFTASSDKDLEISIQKEAKQYVPFDMNDVYLDYQAVGEDKKSRQKDVLLVASKKKVVHDLEDILKSAGLSLNIVDVDAFALSNCYEFNYSDQLEETVYLLNIGAKQSVFCVYGQGQALFFRDLSFGGQQISNIVAKVLDVSRAEAEKIKLNGLSDIEPFRQQECLEEVQSLLSSWAEEIKRLIAFYQSSVDNALEGNKIYLAGGVALMAGAESLLKQELGMDVEKLNSWRKLHIDPEFFDVEYLELVAPQFAIPVGLALRGVDL